MGNEEQNQKNETVVERRRPHGPVWSDTRVVGMVIALVLVTVLVLIARGCSDDGGLDPDRIEVVVVPNSEVVALPTDLNEQLVLAGTWTIEPGDFVTTRPGPNAAEGFLLKALSKEESDGQTTLDTEAASLFDAVPQGSLVANPPAFQEISPTQDFAEYAYAAFDPDEDFNWLACKRSTEWLGLGGGVEPPVFEPFFDMSWKRKGRPTRWIEGSEAGVRSNVTAYASAKTDGQLNCELDPPELSIPIFGAVVFAGPVPVPVTVHARASLDASASTEAQLDATISAGIDGYLALAYRRGAGEKLTGTARLAPELSVPVPKFEASAQADLKVKPGIGMTVGWTAPFLGKVAATARIYFETGFEANWEKGRRPAVEACVPMRLDGQLIFHLLRKSFKPKLPSHEFPKKCVTAGPPEEG